MNPKKKIFLLHDGKFDFATETETNVPEDFQSTIEKLSELEMFEWGKQSNTQEGVLNQIQDSFYKSIGMLQIDTTKTHDLFLSHKKSDFASSINSSMESLARTLKVHFSGHENKLNCFLDKDYIGNSWNDLPDLIGTSGTILVLLSERFVESPWCVLEILSAIMHKRPIAFLEVSSDFDLSKFIKQLREIEFPFVDELNAYNNVLNYNKNHFESSMKDIADRVNGNKKSYPMVKNVVVPRAQVVEQYEKLRTRRNNIFDGKRAWPIWIKVQHLTKEQVQHEQTSSSKIDNNTTLKSISI